MNPNIRIHKDLLVETHQGLRYDKQQSLTLNHCGSEMSTMELASHCVGEIDRFRRGELSSEKYSLELLRRATVQGEQEACMWIQQCFSELVLSWLRSHPKRGAACELESEENYIARTFEGFWQAIAVTQHIEFNSLAEASHYLQACLNGTVIDTLRANSLTKEIPLPEPDEVGGLQSEDNFECHDVWDDLKKVIPNEKEQRLAYLLFHCGLKPRQILHSCPQEFSDIHEIYRLRSNLMNRLVQNADLLHWQPD
jgi:hypothetical protein